MAMTVKELRKLLAKVENQDTLVVLAKDGEGNNYSPLSGYSDHYHYMADSTWAGELINFDDPEGYELDELEPEELEEKKNKATSCFVLWPTN